MQHNVYLYIACMALITYLIRVLPLTLIRRDIRNRTIRSFLYYVPYVTLAVMTFPALLESTQMLRNGFPDRTGTGLYSISGRLVI